LACGEPPAIRQFLITGISIPGWSTLDGIQDIDVPAFHITGFDNPVEQFTGSTHKRFPLSIFVGARPLAEKAKSRRHVADAEDRLRTMRG
jgi:hypothetical protein